MKAQQRMPRRVVAEEAGKRSELEEVVLRLERELLERKRLEQELRHLNDALGLRLSKLNSRLVQTGKELKREKQRRAEDAAKSASLAEDLVRQQRSLQVVNKELESLSYSISHDLRSPLRHVVGFSGALLEDYAETLDGAARSYLDCIGRAGRKMESLIEALLKLSRISRQELCLARVDLSLIAREQAALLKESAPEREVRFSIADGLSARADAALLKIALVNLLENAWKYTGKKAAATIELGRKQEGEGTVFYLSDNGAGFDMRYSDRLFGPFQRMHTESEFEGTGIGLAAVQRIIHRHGGKIWAAAAPDEGATFFFTLGG